MNSSSTEQVIQAITVPGVPAIVDVAPSTLDEVERGLRARGYFVARVDEAPITTKQVLLRSLSEICCFPEYFGDNWDALFDSLTDFSWIPAPGYVLIYQHPERLDSEALATFREVVRDACASWGDRGVSFKLVVPE